MRIEGTGWWWTYSSGQGTMQACWWWLGTRRGCWNLGGHFHRGGLDTVTGSLIDISLTNRFQHPPWNDAALVTSTCSTRPLEWLRCSQALLWVTPTTLHIRLHQWSQVDSSRMLRSQGCNQHGEWLKKAEAPEEWPSIQIAIGMKVMVENVETDLDITNGARGVIVDIILDPNEPPIGNDPIVTLKRLPAYILHRISVSVAESQ